MLTQPINTMVVLSESDQIWRNDVIVQIAKETRQPLQRVMMMTWAQFEAPNKIRTRTGREVELSEMTAHALLRLPRTSKWMFSMSPFPPLIPDEYLDGARQFIEEQATIEAEIQPQKRRHLRLIFAN